MRQILISFLLVVPTTLLAQAPVQTAPKLPVDNESHLVTYKAVVESGSAPMAELQKRAFSWANAYYKNPSDVIRERDTVNGKLTCKARLKITNPPDKKGIVTEAGLIEYTLKLDFKENKFRYTISEINWKQKSYFPIERWIDQTAAGYQPSYSFYLQQTDELMKQLIKDMDKGMKQPTAAIKKDDW